MTRGRILAVAGVVAAAAAVLGAALLFFRSRSWEAWLGHLPGENVLLLHLDVSALRRSPALAPLLADRIEPDPDYAAFVRDTGFDYQRDLDQAAVCYLPDRVYVLARGRFDPARLSAYARSQGGSCSGADLRQPCQMPASRPGRRISFALLSPRILALATAPEPDAVVQLRNEPAVNAAPLVRAAGSLSAGLPAWLWLTASPAALGEALPPGLALIATALSRARRVWLFAGGESSELVLTLHAECASADQAEETRRTLQGLHDLADGLARRARGAQPPSPWEKTLTSARIDRSGAAVRARWTLDPQVLREAGAVTGAAPGSTPSRKDGKPPATGRREGTGKD